MRKEAEGGKRRSIVHRPLEQSGPTSCGCTSGIGRFKALH